MGPDSLLLIYSSEDPPFLTILVGYPILKRADSQFQQDLAPFPTADVSVNWYNNVVYIYVIVLG